MAKEKGIDSFSHSGVAVQKYSGRGEEKCHNPGKLNEQPEALYSFNFMAGVAVWIILKPVQFYIFLYMKLGFQLP